MKDVNDQPETKIEHIRPDRRRLYSHRRVIVVPARDSRKESRRNREHAQRRYNEQTSQREHGKAREPSARRCRRIRPAAQPMPGLSRSQQHQIQHKMGTTVRGECRSSRNSSRQKPAGIGQKKELRRGRQHMAERQGWWCRHQDRRNAPRAAQFATLPAKTRRSRPLKGREGESRL